MYNFPFYNIHVFYLLKFIHKMKIDVYYKKKWKRPCINNPKNIHNILNKYIYIKNINKFYNFIV